MILSNFLTKIKATLVNQKNDSFAEFFLHAPEKEKKRIFEDAARRANDDQRVLVENINKLQRKAT